jgi:predicted glycosyltransferase
LVEKAKRLERERSNFKVLGFTNNALGLFDRSRLVITMGGYNSVCELLHMRKYPLILPRIVPRAEQLIRAKVFSRHGFCDYIHPSELSAQVLGAKVRHMALTDRSGVPAFATNGLQNVARMIEETLECLPKSGSFSKVIPA